MTDDLDIPNLKYKRRKRRERRLMDKKRNGMARELRSGKYRPRVVQDKKKRKKERWSGYDDMEADVRKNVPLET